MALQLSTTTNMGINSDVSYVRISRTQIESPVVGQREQNIHLDWYFNANARNQGKDPIGQCVYTRTLNGGGSIDESYTYLKSLPEFAGAIDC